MVGLVRHTSCRIVEPSVFSPSTGSLDEGSSFLYSSVRTVAINVSSIVGHLISWYPLRTHEQMSIEFAHEVNVLLPRTGALVKAFGAPFGPGLNVGS